MRAVLRRGLLLRIRQRLRHALVTVPACAFMAMLMVYTAVVIRGRRLLGGDQAIRHRETRPPGHRKGGHGEQADDETPEANPLFS